MSVLRQLNILGQMRLDVPHIRSIESSIAADFDVVAGRVQAGEKAVVIRGFSLANFEAGTAANSVQLNTADGILYNMNASESGTFLWVSADRDLETLNSATNGRVSGSFTAGQVNYIGLDYTRTSDPTTTDLVQFLDPNTLLENAKSVPLGRTLDYRIVISTTPFSSSPNLVPIAKVKTDASNNVDGATGSVQDARNILWRLGSGGDFPNRYSSFTWAQNRVESVSGSGVFVGGDKAIQSQKDWMDAVMSRLWEIGGGENWYSTTADRNVRMIRSPGVVFGTTGDNFEWLITGTYVSGTYPRHLHWQGLKIVFDNSNTAAVYYNTVNDQTGDDFAGSAPASKTALADGDCIYVDIDRTSNAAVTAKKAALQTLSVPAIPGSRFVLAWRVGADVYTRDASLAVNVSFQPATTTVVGAVRLNNAPNVSMAGTPTVFTLDTNNSLIVGGASYPIVGTATGAFITGGGAGLGAAITGGPTGGGATISAGATQGIGVVVTGAGTGAGATITALGSGTGLAVAANGAGTGLTVSSASGPGATISVGTSGTMGLAITAGSTSEGQSITVSGGSGRGLDISVQTGQGLRIGNNAGSNHLVELNSTSSGNVIDIDANGVGTGIDIATSTGKGIHIQGNSSATAMTIQSNDFNGPVFTGRFGDGFTYGGGVALTLQGGDAQTNPVAGSFLGGDGIRATGGQGFNYNGGGSLNPGDGGDAGVFVGGIGGFTFGTATGGTGGRGIVVTGGLGGATTSGVQDGTGGFAVYATGGAGAATNGFGGVAIYAAGGTSNSGAPGKAITAFGGTGGTGNGDAIYASPTGTGYAVDARRRTRVHGASTSAIQHFVNDTTLGSIISTVRPLLITADFTNLNETFPYTPGFASNILISGGGSNTGGSGAVQILNQSTSASFNYALEIIQWNGSSYSQNASVDSAGIFRCKGLVSTALSTTIGGDFSSASGYAIKVGTGNAQFTGANPTASTGLTNTLTPKNFVKMWADITLNGSPGNQTVNDGFNVGTPSVASHILTIPIVNDMANANYAVSVLNHDLGVSTTFYWYVYSKTATEVQLKAKYWTTAIVDAPIGAYSSMRLSIMVMGQQ